MGYILLPIFPLSSTISGGGKGILGLPIDFWACAAPRRVYQPLGMLSLKQGKENIHTQSQTRLQNTARQHADSSRIYFHAPKISFPPETAHSQLPKPGDFGTE